MNFQQSWVETRFHVENILLCTMGDKVGLWQQTVYYKQYGHTTYKYNSSHYQAKFEIYTPNTAFENKNSVEKHNSGGPR